MKHAVFLDRDGVINRAIIRNGKPYPPNNIAEVEIFPGVCEAIQKFHDANYIVIVITNQPDVARGTVIRENVEAINSYLLSRCLIDEFMTCYHDDQDNCNCRKPLPGAIIEASIKYGVDLSKSFMVGDRWRDIEAGKRAGCKTIYVSNEYSEKKPLNYDYQVKSLIEVVEIILGG